MENFRQYADAGIAALQQWYEPGTGLWESTDWWNAANIVRVLLDYSLCSQASLFSHIIEHTFRAHQSGRFLNNYYDDEGWWGLSWVQAYDLYGKAHYLHMAQHIFDDMCTGWDETCNGGVWWTKDRTYKNAVTNELFLCLATRLYQRVPEQRDQAFYLNWSSIAWDWFAQSGMLNEHNLINDGLDNNCRNNGQTTWTYNQGVILGALTDLYKVSNNTFFLKQAEAIADAAIETLVDSEGILRESCEDGDCGADGPQFKGIFIRNLSYLFGTSGKPAYREFIVKNASAIIAHSTADYHFGLHWNGPADRTDAACQSAALDAINAALLISGQ